MERILRVFNKPAVRIIEGLLAVFFFYLAAVKLLDSREIAHLTTIGVSAERRIATAVLQIVVGVLLVVGASGYVTAPMVFAVAATEVFVFQRPPLIVAMCVGTHGLTTWLRHAHDSASAPERQKEAVRETVATLQILGPHHSDPIATPLSADSNGPRALDMTENEIEH